MAQRVIEAFADIPVRPDRQSAELDRLRERERNTFELVIRGRSNAEIAAVLYIESSEVKTQVTHALRKLGLPTGPRPSSTPTNVAS